MDSVDSILDIGGNIVWEDGPSVHRLRHRLLPCFKQTFHGLASSLVGDKEGVHECAIEIASEVNRVGSADVLDNRVEDIESRELPFWTRLARVSRLHIAIASVQAWACQ